MASTNLYEIRYRFYITGPQARYVEGKTFFSTTSTSHCDQQARLHASWLSIELKENIVAQHSYQVTKTIKEEEI